MLATIVRSFTCSKTNNICKNLVELLQRYLIDTIHRWGRTIQKRLVSEKDLLLQVTIQGIQNDWYYLKNKVQF